MFYSHLISFAKYTNDCINVIDDIYIPYITLSIIIIVGFVLGKAKKTKCTVCYKPVSFIIIDYVRNPVQTCGNHVHKRLSTFDNKITCIDLKRHVIHNGYDGAVISKLMKFHNNLN